MSDTTLEDLPEPDAAEPKTAPAAEDHCTVTPMFSHHPVRSKVLPPEHAVSIDIYEHPAVAPPQDRTGGATLSIPSRIVIDGQPVYLPKNSDITVKAGLQATEVTVTLFARRVRIGYADELDGPVGLPAGQPAPEPGEG
ncbi:hypothetical protein [Planomonospora sp. ID82291]|uniref:hypothetical protein n=1 Tax=Planomonospora sp. ID82291 TaxID=2738136 RepID=UPI0018C3997B|nr:hypothetical protein [Planomonospora sp. ID82291]MBG0818982.1 hypothetical protein [Planomonospora sp. ID82291]